MPVNSVAVDNASAIQKAKEQQRQEQIKRDTVKVDPKGNERPATTVTNPKGNLDGKAFMKLLLTELKYQDPTQPMDSEKMLAQTSQLATLETQESTNKLMKELAQSLKSQTSSGANAYAISAIGKLASIGKVDIAVTKEQTGTGFDIYFPENGDGPGKLIIKDNKNNEIYMRDIENIKKGVQNFQWDLKDNTGKRVENDTYTVSVEYVGEDGKTHTVKPGLYPVEAVKFVKGEAQLKVGHSYVPMKNVKEFIGA